MRAALRGAWQRFCSRCREGLRSGARRRFAACKRGHGRAAVLGVYCSSGLRRFDLCTELCSCFWGAPLKIESKLRAPSRRPKQACIQGKLVFVTLPKALGTRPKAARLHVRVPHFGRRRVARRIRPGSRRLPEIDRQAARATAEPQDCGPGARTTPP